MSHNNPQFHLFHSVATNIKMGTVFHRIQLSLSNTQTQKYSRLFTSHKSALETKTKLMSVNISANVD